ncbi:VanZ family protein [Sanguibacter sp. HDW7]|uniref:VanZ family protein n=1 Tax=Sanguibacter sp. HDW7 TaxID=2714931 RepID=UPI00140B3749|nr:VanZ family protein [Sanguibacter sp. HDW7]QIK82527.1 VanZ family protein [Sanguibacter sp. HDW7]
MGAWTWPAYIGVLFGTLLFAGLLIPLTIWQSRRYGRLSVRRFLGAAAVAVYGVSLAAYTLLPIPSGDLARWCAEYGVDGAQTHLLQFVDDIRRDTAGLGLRATVLHTTVLQVVLNVALFVPWGVLWRRFLGRGILTATLSGLLVSLAIETTQYTGIFGLVGCSYRVGDVDDLLTNTVGAFLGAVLAPLLLHWMPQSRDLARERGLPRPVRARRRWGSMLLDALLFSGLAALGSLAWRLGLAVTGRELGDPTWGEWLAGSAVPFLLVFVLPVLGSGASLGQRALWLVPVRDGARPSFGRRAVRSFLPGGLWGVLLVLPALPDDPHLPGWVATAPFELVAALLAIVSVLGVLTTKDHRSLSGSIAGVTYVDARSR